MEEIKPIAFLLRFNTINHLDVFVKRDFKELVIDCFISVGKAFSVEIKGYVLMADHISLVVIPDNSRDFRSFYETLKKTISQRVMEALESDRFSEKRWLLFLINFINKENSEGGENRIWNLDNPVKKLFSENEVEAQLQALHQEPVKEGIVSKPEDYNYSSLKENLTELSFLDREVG